MLSFNIFSTCLVETFKTNDWIILETLNEDRQLQHGMPKENHFRDMTRHGKDKAVVKAQGCMLQWQRIMRKMDRRDRKLDWL